ncbi:unnamed protein product [Urochloa humidicola]
MVFSDDDDLLTQWWEEEDEYESESESNHDDNDGLLAILLLADMEHERCKITGSSQWVMELEVNSTPMGSGRCYFSAASADANVLCDPCPCTRNT